MTRSRKIQTRHKVSGFAGQRVTRVSPSLELAGDWFRAAGFTPGQLVSIESGNGVITIRPQ